MREFSFYQGFSLRRERLAGMLQAVAANSTASDEEIGRHMGVNPYMVEGFQGWLCKTGLGSKQHKDYKLTPFGRLAVQYDPLLSDQGTSWILHFYLSTQHDERAEVWYRFFNQFIVPHQTFTRDELAVAISRSIEEPPKNKASLTKDIGELLKAYTNTDALGALGLLQKSGKEHYFSGNNSLPHALIGAFMLFDTWNRYFSATDTLRLTQISQELEMLGKVIIGSRERIQSLIGQLQTLGLLVIADTQHEPVTRRFKESPFLLLEKYYQQL
ncbi:DUF4007 family protein [Herpetosiphon gulosus]|uniref:DUF4007 domain-containing protein n=1 Tax=Herpetosiphon gulosus TaxID=1973496 RepID=A0ABP9X3D5_9CHLR